MARIMEFKSYNNQYANTVNSEIFRENFIFANSVKRHISKVNKTRHWSMIYLLPISKRQRDFPISRGFSFHEKKNPWENFRIYSILVKFSNFTYIVGLVN